MKRIVTVGMRVFLANVVCGSAFLLCACMNLVDLVTTNIPAKIVNIAGLALVCVIYLYLMKAETEKKDELAEMEMYKAKSSALDFFNLAILLLMVVTAALLLGSGHIFDADLTLSLNSLIKIIQIVLFAYFGIQNLMTGLIFRRLEKE